MKLWHLTKAVCLFLFTSFYCSHKGCKSKEATMVFQSFPGRVRLVETWGLLRNKKHSHAPLPTISGIIWFVQMIFSLCGWWQASLWPCRKDIGAKHGWYNYSSSFNSGWNNDGSIKCQHSGHNAKKLILHQVGGSWHFTADFPFQTINLHCQRHPNT